MTSLTPPESAKRFRNFAEFYPFYLSEHADRRCRRLHFIGTTGVLGCLLLAFVTVNTWWLLGALLCGYGFAWVGHFFFEHNKPATFKYPWYSLMGDWRLWWNILNGKVRI